MFRNIKILLVALAVIIIAGGTYAFAAANTVPDTAAGYKASTVSGYTISNIVYDLNNTDPRVVDAITFDVVPTSGDSVAVLVKVQTANSGNWKDCTLGTVTGSSVAVTCGYTTGDPLNLVDVTALNIVASSTIDPAP